MGTQACVNGTWAESCDGVVLPRKKLCDGNGKDEDCDGAADLSDKDCECLDRTTQFCELRGRKGDCKWGQKTCTAGHWGRWNE